jgi:hypothetical protein
MRVKAALLHNEPAAADMQYKGGDLVLSNYENRDTWDEPFEVIAVDYKILTVRDPNNPERWKSTRYQKRFNKQQLRPYVIGEGDHSTHLVNQMLSWLSNEAILSAHPTKIFSPTDPRQNDQKFITAKQKKLQVSRVGDLEGRAEVRDTDKCERLARFVLTIKDSGTDNEIFKERYVVRGFNDIRKAHLIHYNPVS